MKYLLISLTLLILSTDTTSAQQDFFLKNKKSGRLKKLRPQTNFGFEVIIDSSKRLSYFGRITQMTDSTLTIEEYVKPSLRRAISKQDFNRVSEQFKPKIWVIKTQNIKSIKNYLIDDDDFNILGGMVIIGGVLAVIGTPIIWVAEGKERGQEAALISVGLFAAGGLLLLPQVIGKRRKMTKWEFVKGLQRPTACFCNGAVTSWYKVLSSFHAWSRGTARGFAKAPLQKHKRCAP